MDFFCAAEAINCEGSRDLPDVWKPFAGIFETKLKFSDSAHLKVSVNFMKFTEIILNLIRINAKGPRFNEITL